MSRAGVAWVDVRGDFSSLNRGLRQHASSQAGPMRKLGAGLGGALATGVSVGVKAGAVGVGAAMVYSLKKAGDFESQVSSLGSVSDASGKQLRALSKQALKAGADTKFSALEAARAQTELAKGGLGVAKIMRGGLKSALALAAAGEMDLAAAAETTVNQMKLFGLRGKDAMKIADGLATAANSTTADVSDFALAFKQGGSAAKTAGLDFQETTAWLETLAEAGIKGSDAGTSLKTALIHLASPSSLKAQKMAKGLGIDVFDAAGNMKSLTDVSAILQKSLGGLTREQRIQAATTLVGQDGFRALLALYDAGPKKVDRLQRELHKQGTAAKVAKDKQDNLKGSLEQMTGSFETLGIQIGTAAIPEVREFTDDITGLANRIGRIVGRDDLDLGEKLNRILAVTKVSAQPWVDKLEEGIRQANLPQRLGDLLAATIGIAATKVAPLAAKSFVTAFMDTNAWGRLAIGGWLFAKMGGRPAFLKLGTTAGAATGAGMATGIGASGLKGKMAGMLRGWGPTMALALAATLGPDLIKAIDEKAHPASSGGLPKTGDRISQILREGIIRNPFKENDSALRHFGDTADATFSKLKKLDDVNGMRRLAEQARALARDFPQASKELNHFADQVDGVRKPSESVKNAIARMEAGTSSSLGSMRTNVRLTTKLIKNRLGKDTEEGKKALVANFNAAATNIARSMTEGKISVKGGLREIERLMVKALQGMGFSKKQALAVRGAGKSGTTHAVDSNGELRPTQRGAYISDGKPVGDSVPALLEKGEYVLNRKAVQKVGRGRLDRLNFGDAPRFQTGGIVELLHPFNDPAGHGGSNSHIHIAMANIQALIALGRRLQGLGWLVSENPAFGGVHGGHAAGGYHPTGQAIDVNWPDAGAEGAKIRALLPMLQAMSSGGMGALAPDLARMLVTGPDSPLKTLAQSALDLTHGAAQSVIDGASGGIEGAEFGAGAASGNGADLMRSIAKQRGWNFADWWEIDGRETGHGANLLNPSSGAFNRAQFLPMNRGKYGPGSLPGAPMDDQIRSMAAYIADRYGNPTSAREFHDSHNWYQRGGLIGMLTGGGIGKALRKVQGSRSPKLRREAVSGLLDKVDGIDMPADLKADLKRLAGDANTAGEFANRASQLTVTDDDGAVTEGVAGGKTQVQWLTEQLTALFQWRNRIIDAEKIVVEKRAETSALIEQARERLNAVRAEIAAAAKTRKRLTERLAGIRGRITDLRKHPKKNAAKIADLVTRATGLRSNIAEIDSAQTGRGRVRDTLHEKILPALKTKRTDLNTARGDLLTNLETVQGIGSPMGRLGALPDVGVLGGTIFDVQMRLRELAAEKPKVTDTSTPADDPSKEALAQLLREANQRTAVSEAQFEVFKNFPFGGNFSLGGTVMGPPGAPRTIVAHGGERVLNRDEAEAGASRVRVVVEDHRTRVFVDDVEQIVDKAMRREARAGARGLPGRAGVMR